MKKAKGLFTNQDIVIRPGSESRHTQACLEVHQGVGRNEDFTCTDNCLEKPQHTPTPWTLDEAGIIWGPHEELAGKSKGYQCIAEEIELEDAAFIVRAVNCHEELLAACKEVLDWVLATEVREQLSKAIAKAEGK